MISTEQGVIETVVMVMVMVLETELEKLVVIVTAMVTASPFHRHHMGVAVESSTLPRCQVLLQSQTHHISAQ